MLFKGKPCLSVQTRGGRSGEKRSKLGHAGLGLTGLGARGERFGGKRSTFRLLKLGLTGLARTPLVQAEII